MKLILGLSTITGFNDLNTNETSSGIQPVYSGGNKRENPVRMADKSSGRKVRFLSRV